jgi:hypothetical protein
MFIMQTIGGNTMSRITDLRKFPPEFEELLTVAASRSVVLTFPETKMTMQFRHRFYDYMRTVRALPEKSHLHAAAASVTILMTDDRYGLTVGKPQDHWESAMLREALRLGEPELPLELGQGQAVAEALEHRKEPVVHDPAIARHALHEKLAELRQSRATENAQKEEQKPGG